MIITGNMSVPKGYKGAVWFVQKVLPSLDEAEYELVIAGRNPHPDLVDACKTVPSVTLIPNPVDMDILLKDADVFVNPSSNGSGIKVRNFDGLRSGLPVICHAGNAYGFEHMPCGVFSAFKDADTFAACYHEIKIKIHELGSHLDIRKYYEEECSLKQGALVFRKLLDD
jgi:glycosyltransferase involved in cell wall biosynthesis